MTWRQFGLMCFTGFVILAGMAICNLLVVRPAW